MFAWQELSWELAPVLLVHSGVSRSLLEGAQAFDCWPSAQGLASDWMLGICGRLIGSVSFPVCLSLVPSSSPGGLSLWSDAVSSSALDMSTQPRSSTPRSCQPEVGWKCPVGLGRGWGSHALWTGLQAGLSLGWSEVPCRWNRLRGSWSRSCSKGVGVLGPTLIEWGVGGLHS
jgi:hypothetical protein